MSMTRMGKWRLAVSCASALVLVALCALAIGLKQEIKAQPVTAQVEQEQDPILDFITERAALRREQTRQLEQMMNDENLDIVLRGEAGAQLLRLLEYSEQETTIEGVLRVRGFEDAVVTVHADSANVLVRTPSLSRDQSAQILELVSRETGLLGGNIKIIPIN